MKQLTDPQQLQTRPGETFQNVTTGRKHLRGLRVPVALYTPRPREAMISGRKVGYATNWNVVVGLLTIDAYGKDGGRWS